MKRRRRVTVTIGVRGPAIAQSSSNRRTGWLPRLRHRESQHFTRATWARRGRAPNTSLGAPNRCPRAGVSGRRVESVGRVGLGSVDARPRGWLTHRVPTARRSKKPPASSAYPRVEVATRAALRRWLAAHHASAKGAWIVTRKRAAGGEVSWNDVVEEALCVGWIDSLPRKVDDDRSMLLLTPRKPASKWSAKNKAHIADLEARGLMRAAGLSAVARARANGTWEALDAVSALVVPPDLAAALGAHDDARAHWERFPPSTRRGILEWIAAAKRPETRAARVDETARLAAQNVRANQWPRRA